MSTSRRDFMKLFGVSLASLLLTRCQWRLPIPATCYAPMVPDFTPTSDIDHLDARGRLRLCWLRFGELAEKTRNGLNQGSDSWEDKLGRQMIADHRAALDELVASGDITPAVADLVQEAYSAAVYHVWRSNVPITCYEPMVVDYAPASASSLVQQSGILGQVAAQGTVDPQTLAKAQAALEHDMAYYALSQEDVQALYQRLMKAYQDSGQSIPSFEAVELEMTPDARSAAQFILDVLSPK
jgi:hypothetical protein